LFFISFSAIIIKTLQSAKAAGPKAVSSFGGLNMRHSDNYPNPPSQHNRHARMRKRKIILFLRLFILVMIFIIIGLSIFLIGRAFYSGTNTAKTTTIVNTSSSADVSSLTSSAATTASAVAAVSPSPTAAVPTVTEILQQAAVVDSFFGPLPVAESVVPVTHNEIHAIYLGAAANLDKSITLAKNSEINAFVIDLKESNGVMFNSTNALAIELGVVKSYYNLADVIKKCHDNDIKVIGRIVCFKDPEFAKQKPEYVIKDASGNILYFKNEGKNSFANPYDTRTWDYIIDLAIEAVTAGVDEIQFDYIRFPTGGTTSGEKPYFGDPATTPTKVEVINRFLQTARIRISDEYGIPFSADVFGIILSSASDGASLGQDWTTVGLTGVDSLCPMLYPSHYALNTILNGKNFDKPDYYPYDVLLNSLTMGKKDASAPGFATVRPYLQAFTASYIGEGNYITYGYEQINAQIKAVHDAGYKEWVLWNPSAKYPDGVYDGVS